MKKQIVALWAIMLFTAACAIGQKAEPAQKKPKTLRTEQEKAVESAPSGMYAEPGEPRAKGEFTQEEIAEITNYLNERAERINAEREKEYAPKPESDSFQTTEVDEDDIDRGVSGMARPAATKAGKPKLKKRPRG